MPMQSSSPPVSRRPGWCGHLASGCRSTRSRDTQSRSRTTAGLQPKMTIAHESKKVFVSPLNGGLRAAGIADFTGFDPAIDPVRVDVLKRALSALYPQADLGGELHAWAGLRAMTHDGPPVIFGIPNSGIWINSGHGSLGWTFACGAAKMTSNLVTTNRWEPENPYFGLARRWHG